MKKTYAIASALLLSASVAISQSSFPPAEIIQGEYLGETIPLRDMETITPLANTDDVPIIPNNMRNASRNNPDALPNGPDPLKQTSPQFRPGMLLENFDGIDIAQGQARPPDPSGAVGPNHYVHGVNLAVEVYDKSGTSLVGPVPLSAFIGGGVNNGDPIMMYDQLADRWFVSQFRLSDDALIVAVSTTPDPTDTFNMYSFPLDAFPDYPHYSVWPDAYYLTANKFSGNVMYALDRQAMIDGDASPTIIGFNLPGVIRNPNTVFSPEPANLLGTDFPTDVPGYIIYLQDDSWSGAITFDHVKIWEVDVDFDTPANSTISAPEQIALTAFESVFFPFGSGDVRQPGTSQRIDNIGGVISYMANYRSFPTHNSFLFNFNVDLGANVSGIRWVELRNVGNGPFTVFQEGTYDLADGENRFMGSMAMDVDGDIGLAFNVGSENTEVGIRFTGRVATDPLGQMTVTETTIQDGQGVQTVSNRFGDYAQLTMDPNGRTFWHTAEYFRSNNNWRTKIASFEIDDDFGVDDITNNDIGTLEVFPGVTGTHEISLVTTTAFSEMNFEVLDIQAKRVSNGSLSSSDTGFTGTFNSEKLAAGVYIVRVSNGNFELSKKVIIQ